MDDAIIYIEVNRVEIKGIFRIRKASFFTFECSNCTIIESRFASFSNIYYSLPRICAAFVVPKQLSNYLH